MNYHNYTINDAVFIILYRLYDPHLWRVSRNSQKIFSIYSKYPVFYGEEGRVPGSRAGKCNIARFLSQRGRARRGHVQEAKETNARTKSRSLQSRASGKLRRRKDGEERDCCARICNSRSICKRQRNLNRGNARNHGCVSTSFRLSREIRESEFAALHAVYICI